MSLIARVRKWWQMRQWRVVYRGPDMPKKYSVRIDVDGKHYRLYMNDVLVADQ